MKRSVRLIILTICSMLVFTACKGSDNSSSNPGNGGEGQQQQQQVEKGSALQTGIYTALSDFDEKKYANMGNLAELLEASDLNVDQFNLEQFQQMATRPFYMADEDLHTTLYCMRNLDVKAENDWTLQHERYSGYMDYVNDEYRFEFFIAAEGEETSTMGTPRPNEESELEIDPMETAETITEAPPMIPDELAGYIEGRMVDGSNRMALNAYTGREEEGTRAQTLWFEFVRDTDGGYWAQYYYAWDNVGAEFNTLRVHVHGDSLSYAVLESTERPESIFSLELDEGTYFADAQSTMQFDGSKATYTEEGEVMFKF